MALAIVVLVLSAIGFFDMLYAANIHYRWYDPSSTLSGVCGLQEGSCNVTFQAPQAEILGIPLSALGMIYFAILVAIAIVRLSTGNWPFKAFLAPVTVVAAIFSIYLAAMLQYVLNENCTVCLLAHSINIALAIVLTSTLGFPRWPRRIPLQS